jgi:protocatechuate 3,4-dioxygenase beta subunit
MKFVWIAWFSLIAHAAFGYQAPGASIANAPKGIIEGQVVNGATGAPLRKTGVRLFGLGQRQGGGGMQVRETDEQGHFLFTGLEPGRYQLSAERTGFLRQNYGARKYSGGGTPIPLSQDQHIKDIVFKLSPQGVIAGKVVDEDGDPVANLQVRAMRYVYRNGKKQWAQVANGQTSDIGEYRIANLEPGRYLVSTNSRGADPAMMMQTPSAEPPPTTPEMAYAATFYPSAADSANAVPVDLGAGSEMRGINIRLVKTRVFRVRGKAINTVGGSNRQTTMVMLQSKDGTGTIPNMAPVRPPDNLFEIRNVAPGSYIVFARSGNGQNQSIAWQAVEVANNHVDGVMLTVAPGVDVQGSFKIADATAALSAPNLSVFLRGTFAIAGAPRARVADDLSFTFQNVSPMHYTVMVSGVPDNCYVKSIRFGGQEVPEDGVDIAGGGPFEITLSATAAEVDGAVVDKEGKPVANATVALIPKDGPPTAIKANNTDENGAVAFKGLKPGDYRLLAWEDVPSGAYQDPEFLKPFEGRAASVKLDPSAKQAVQVKVIPVEETDK